jgi:hypothetical protein
MTAIGIDHMATPVIGCRSAPPEVSDLDLTLHPSDPTAAAKGAAGSQVAQ